MLVAGLVATPAEDGYRRARVLDVAPGVAIAPLDFAWTLCPQAVRGLIRERRALHPTHAAGGAAQILFAPHSDHSQAPLTHGSPGCGGSTQVPVASSHQA